MLPQSLRSPQQVETRRTNMVGPNSVRSSTSDRQKRKDVRGRRPNRTWSASIRFGSDVSLPRAASISSRPARPSSLPTFPLIHTLLPTHSHSHFHTHPPFPYPSCPAPLPRVFVTTSSRLRLSPRPLGSRSSAGPRTGSTGSSAWRSSVRSMTPGRGSSAVSTHPSSLGDRHANVVLNSCSSRQPDLGRRRED